MTQVAIEDQIIQRYDSVGQLTRKHIKTRLKLCPFPTIMEQLPLEGPFLDIGCGHGHLCWWTHYSRPGHEIHGCDIDKDKIKIAESTLQPDTAHQVSFYLKPPEDTFDENKKFKGITIIDILYLINEAEQKRILRWAVDHLEPGGKIVLKVLDTEAGWKTKKALLQEWVMVSLLKKTVQKDKGFFALPPNTYKEWLSELGCDAQILSLKTMNPSALICGTKIS